MKKYFLVFAILISALRLSAQTNEPIRLALISESDEASAASDILTAQLSGNQKIHLLERDEIEKAYREQGMSAANRDDLKLGRILGADGLLLLDVVKTRQATNLTARLITVKPGVILTDGSFAWPPKDTIQWSESVAVYLNSFLPKLAMPAKDAIPISVVNLRSAISSAEGAEAERQLKLLMIQRLSREKQFFVLERQKMQLLGEEKELKLDDSAFWNGSYLLEGVVDQNGYSKETITINARLTPPKGGAPLQFEVSGSRTNLADVINQLAVKIIDALKINSAVKEWNAADEAAQYLDEAKWALRWGILPEAQAAADSAWALGKRDKDCATIRIRTYEDSLEAAMISEEEFIDSSIVYSTEKADQDSLARKIKGISATHIAVFFETNKNGISCIGLSKRPDPRDIDCAFHALELYYEFSQTSTDGVPKILWRGAGWNDWHNSDWYQLGIDTLVAASKVLQDFNFFPESQKPVADKLAELRALARSVAELISKSPSVHDSYFVGGRFVTHDELANTIGEDGGRNPNIFNCKLKWGSLWQETPEDCVALYRELMSSPVFCYIHSILWAHQTQLPVGDTINFEPPRLVAWNAEDRQRIPIVWSNFVKELNDSTNVFLQLEAKAIEFADVDEEKGEAFTNFFDALFANHDALVTNNIEMLYLNWGADDLMNVRRGIGAFSISIPDSLQRQFYSDYRPKLEAMDKEYWNKTVPAQKMFAAFEKQKQFFANFTPYDFSTFNEIFSARDYTKAQAAELQPLIATYKSNMVAQASEQKKFKAKSDAHWIEFFLEERINEILNPPMPQSAKAENVQHTHVPSLSAHVAQPEVHLKKPAETVTNILLVENFLKIPREQLPKEEQLFEEDEKRNFRIVGNRWCEGKLVLDLRYTVEMHVGGGGGEVTKAVAVIFDPMSKSWEILKYPTDIYESGYPTWPRDGVPFEIYQGNFYFSDGDQLKKFDFKTRQWKTLNFPGLNNSRLFAVAGHFYAASRNAIFEIPDDEKTTHILASTRRRPAVSILDSLDNLGSPILFSGLDHSLCASIANKIYRWDGHDWQEVLTVNISQPPEIFEDAVIFRAIPSYGSDDPASLWVWKKDQTPPELCLLDKHKPHPNIINSRFRKPDDQTLHPLWKSPADEYLASCGATFFRSNLYFFVDHAVVTNSSGHWTAMEQDGYHARLVCLSRDLSEPIGVPLKFDVERGQPPLKSLGEKFAQASWLAGATWMCFAGDSLYIGQPDSPTIWVIRTSELESAIAAQKQIQIAKQSQLAAAAEQVKKEKEQVRKNLLAKYDRDHNGVIDPDEREEALDDPAFIESELDAIDANHNGWLDVEELSYFDANTNKILETKERAGIDIAQHLLAAKLLKKFDVNADGFIDRSEFDDLWHSNQRNNGPGMQGYDLNFLFPDKDRDGLVDSEELEIFLKQQTRGSLRSRRMSGHHFSSPMRVDSPDDTQQLFKVEIESYWQNLGGNTNTTQGGKAQ